MIKKDEKKYELSWIVNALANAGIVWPCVTPYVNEGNE